MNTNDENKKDTNDIFALPEKESEDYYVPDFLRFDVGHLVKAVISKVHFMAVVAIIFGIFALVTVKSKYITTCVLIKSPEASTLDNDKLFIPAYSSTNTIVNMIEALNTRDNRLETIKRLDLKMGEKALARIVRFHFGKLSQKHKINTNLINITVAHENNKRAADIANTFAQVFIESRELKQDINDRKVLNYYINKKDEINEQIEAIRQEELTFKRKYGITSSLESQISSRYRELENLKSELVNKEMEILMVKEDDKKKLILLQEELNKLKSRYTSENIRIKELTEEIRFLEEKILNSDYSGNNSDMDDETLSKYELKVEVIEKQIDVIKKRIAEKNYEIKNLSELLDQHKLIKNKIARNLELISSLEKKVTDQKGKMHANINDLEILEAATVPHFAAPSRSSKFLAGGFIGGALTFVILLLLELFNFSVKSGYDFENIFLIKMVTKIPLMRKKKKKNKKFKNRFYSSMHLINDYLTFSAKKPRLITLGSDIPKAGKTFIARNVIRLLSSQDNKILYISAKRGGRLPEQKAAACINDFLYYGKDTIKPIEIAQNFSQCFFRLNKDIYARILDRDRVKALLEKYSDFDYIIWELFDPDINLLSFVNIVLSSNIFLIVAKFRKSTRNRIKKIVNLLREKKFIHILGVLNHVKKFYY